MPIQISKPDPETHAQSNGAPPAYDGMPWPESLDGDALSGLAGDVVRLIEPHSEADPAALLVQFLIAFGNAAGRAA